MKSSSHLYASSSDPAPGRSTKLKTTKLNIIGDYYNGITRREDNR
ncbi:hypothetical protein [Butyrivibrio sp. XBB1001]|nr:hypothetical protein [Butyrivibrio sp. XBB1001]